MTLLARARVGNAIRRLYQHSHEDKAAADAACATLEQAGIRCWISPRDIVPGMDWSESIINAIERAKLMVLIFDFALDLR